MTGRDPSGGSLGFHQLLFTIEEISGGYAYGTDQFLVSRKIPMGVQRAKGAAPLVGEQWLITKDLGPWVFAAIMNNPAVSGGFVTIDVHGTEGGFPGGEPAVLTVLLPDGYSVGPGVRTGPFVAGGSPGLVEEESDLFGSSPPELGYGVLNLDSSDTVISGAWMTASSGNDSVVAVAAGNGNVIMQAQPGFAGVAMAASPMSAALRSQGTGSGRNYSILQMNNGSGNANLMVGKGDPLGSVPTDGSPSMYFDAYDGTVWQNLDGGGSNTGWTALPFGEQVITMHAGSSGWPFGDTSLTIEAGGAFTPAGTATGAWSVVEFGAAISGYGTFYLDSSYNITSFSTTAGYGLGPVGVMEVVSGGVDAAETLITAMPTAGYTAPQIAASSTGQVAVVSSAPLPSGPPDYTTPYGFKVVDTSYEGILLKEMHSNGNITLSGSGTEIQMYGGDVVLSGTGTLSFMGFSQLPTFAPRQASSAPAYSEGDWYYDTTLHKLRIGGATGWETVTSV